MSTQTLVLDGVTSSSGLSGASVANLSAQDASWATATSNNVATAVLATMPTPTGPPNAGANLQTITAQVRKNSASGSGTPTAHIEVWIDGGGAPVLTGSSTNVTSTTGQTLTFTFDYSAVTGANADGSNLSVQVVGTQTGGSPSSRASVDIGYVGWTVDYSLGSRTGSASGTIGLAGAATGKIAVKASASTALVLTGSASGKVAVKGAAAGSLALIGSATGMVSNPGVHGSATGSLPLSGSGSAKVSVAAGASATIGLTGSASASAKVRGSVASAFLLSGSGAGKVSLRGATVGQLGLSGSASGTTGGEMPPPHVSRRHSRPFGLHMMGI